MRVLLMALAAATAGAQPDTAGLLARVSEEAETFRRMAPQTLTEETLVQRAARAMPRYRPRPGGAAAPTRPVVLLTREIVSEYSVGNIPEAGRDNLFEFRQIISVDGRPIQTRQTARHALSLDLKKPDENVRKRMLEDFEKQGIPGASVTDFGTVLLLFCKRLLPQIACSVSGASRVGPDAAWVLAYRFNGDTARVLEFHGRRTARQTLTGDLFVRQSDGLPLRVTVVARRTLDQQAWVDEASVEYVQSSHGFLTPVSVAHRRTVDGLLTVENRFRYAPFKLFGASAEIKFSELPDPPKP